MLRDTDSKTPGESSSFQLPESVNNDSMKLENFRKDWRFAGEASEASPRQIRSNPKRPPGVSKLWYRVKLHKYDINICIIIITNSSFSG
jgi:hypothetical protein